MQNVIPRPNMDQSLVQTERLVTRLEAELAHAEANCPDQDKIDALRRRIDTLACWLRQRRRNPQIPWEYRPRIYRRKAEPLMDPDLAYQIACKQAAVRKAYFLSKKKAS